MVSASVTQDQTNVNDVDDRVHLFKSFQTIRKPNNIVFIVAKPNDFLINFIAVFVQTLKLDYNKQKI